MSLKTPPGEKRMPTRSAPQTLRDGYSHFQREPGAIAHRPAVFIGALVRAIAEKLIQQIAIGIVNFHAVKAGDFGAFSRGGILRHDARQFLFLQCPRRDVRLHPIFREHLAGARSDGAGRDRQSAVRLETRMRNPAHVPELEKNPSAGIMHRIGHALPARDLFRSVNAGRIGTARALLGNRRGFTDDQSRRRTLRIIFRHQRRGHAARPRAHPGERSHDDAVWRFNRA